MFIDANEIIALVQAAKDCQERLPESEQWIHFRDIEATLQKLIDDEISRLDVMAEEFEAREEDWELRLADAFNYEEEKYGRLQMEEDAIEKELEVDFNWPHGV